VSQIVLLSGPGGHAFNHENVEKIATAMRSFGAEVTVLGDGEAPVNKAQVMETLETIANKSNEPVTLFITAHGDVIHGSHAIDIDGNWGLTSAELFEAISNSFGRRPTDVFMTCCHGGAAILEVNRLPHGSTLVTLAPGREVASQADVDRLADNIDSGSLQAHHLLNLYLGKALKNRIAPSLAISGQGVRDLPREFIARIGKPFPENEKIAAHSALDSILGVQHVDEIMDKISGARSEYGIYAADFGPALAVTLASSSRMQELSSYDPTRSSHSSPEDDNNNWFHRMSMRSSEDALFRGGKRTQPKRREEGWIDNT